MTDSNLMLEVVPYAAQPRITRYRDPLPSDSSLRAIFADEPQTTIEELAEYYCCSTGRVSRRLKAAGITLVNPSRKLPPDDELRDLIAAAAVTGYAPLVEQYGVTRAALSKAKARLGVVWPQKRVLKVAA